MTLQASTGNKHVYNVDALNILTAFVVMKVAKALFLKLNVAPSALKMPPPFCENTQQEE